MLAPVRKWPVVWNTHVPALSAPEAGAAVAVGKCGKGDQPCDKQTGCKPPLGADHGAPPKKKKALLTDPWVGSAGQDGSVTGEAEYRESDQGAG
jgi:hypothetical protein